MFKYFTELLCTLNSIDNNLKELRKIEKSTNVCMLKLSGCVEQNHHGHGDLSSISTKHWNDNN
jgi:hypothetical protein